MTFNPNMGWQSRTRHYGAAFTTLKDRKKELGRGLLHEMCGQLGISEKDLEGR